MPLAGFLSGREQWSNPDFRVVLGWFRVGKCRFTNDVHLPSKEHLFQRSYMIIKIVLKVSYAFGGISIWPGTAVKC